MLKKIVVLGVEDNVATSLMSLAAGDVVTVEVGSERREITIRDAVPFGHKIAITAMAAGQEVLKYGEVIGRASQVIEPGAWVHVHNIESVRGRGDLE